MDKHHRQLTHVPILHSRADMGTLQERFEAAYVEQFGRRRWEEHVALTDRFWHLIRVELDGLHLNYRRVNLYQDGLPVCGKELEIVEETAAKGSENHRLLMELVARGATLIGTEDPNLLLEEYRAVKAGLAARPDRHPSAGNVGGPASSEEILARRDAYIGRQIAETLLPGRTGILFLGMMHRVQLYLPADILIVRLHLDVAASEDTA